MDKQYKSNYVAVHPIFMGCRESNIFVSMRTGEPARHFADLGRTNMKYSVLLLALLANTAFAKDVYVQPHVTKNGTYVQGHYRSAPDTNPYNNYGTQGNANPYTGQAGTRDPYQVQQQYQPSSLYPNTNRGNSSLGGR